MRISHSFRARQFFGHRLANEIVSVVSQIVSQIVHSHEQLMRQLRAT